VFALHGERVFVSRIRERSLFRLAIVKNTLRVRAIYSLHPIASGCRSANMEARYDRENLSGKEEGP